MTAAEFKFFEAYRRLAPAASRETVDIRIQDHGKLYPLLDEETARVYDACRLAFQLPATSAGVLEWFEKTIKELDPQFSIEHDGAEAARIAALLLRNLISSGDTAAALAVLVCSCSGLRLPIDSELLTEANHALASAASARKIAQDVKKISAPRAKDLKAALDALQANWGPEVTRTAIDASVGDLRNGINEVASTANAAYRSLRADVVHLAEETDMLWWHIGDWSELLSRARTKLSKNSTGLVSGIELGSLVRLIPGPYGAYGILRRALGTSADEKVKLSDILVSLGADVGLLASDLPDTALPVFPIHAALSLAKRDNVNWQSAFGKTVAGLKEIELTNFDLAVQVLRERILIVHGGLE